MIKIGFYSQKGGPGKSNTCVAFGRKLRDLGHAVGIFDLDVTNTSIEVLLPTEDDLQFGEQLLPFEIEGMKVFGIGYMPENDLTTLWDDRRSADIAKQLFEIVDWGDIDYLLIDMPPLSSDVVHTILKQFDPLTDGIVLVTTPRPEDTLDGTRTVDLLKEYRVEIFGVVINKAYVLFKCRQCETSHQVWLGPVTEKDIRKKWKKRILAKVPLFFGDILADKYIPDKVVRYLRTRVI